MKKPESKRMWEVARTMKKQSPVEMCAVLNTVEKELGLIVVCLFVIIPSNDARGFCSILTADIYGVQPDEDYLYILCNDHSMYVFGLKEAGLIIVLLDYPPFWDEFRRRCRSYFNRIRTALGI